MMNSELCNPEDLILTQMPAPPVAIRPSIAVSATCTNQDDLTMSLANMVRINTDIEKVISRGNTSNKLLTLWSELQWACALYFNSETPNVPQQF